jgi:hypothetical protein
VTFAPVCGSHAHASQCILHAVSHVTGLNEVELADGQANRLLHGAARRVQSVTFPAASACFAWCEGTHAKFCSNNSAVFSKCAFCYYTLRCSLPFLQISQCKFTNYHIHTPKYSKQKLHPSSINLIMIWRRYQILKLQNPFGRCYHPPPRGKHIPLSIISKSFVAGHKIWGKYERCW